MHGGIDDEPRHESTEATASRHVGTEEHRSAEAAPKRGSSTEPPKSLAEQSGLAREASSYAYANMSVTDRHVFPLD
jgi:hypothetical protein